MKLAIAYALMLFVTGCAHGPSGAGGSLQHGKCSWYGRDFQGKKTASGERFDMHKLTAAHRTLPFGTSVRVRRLDNHESVIVTINDRGPYADDRIIDLSYAAAKRLGMLDVGTAAVEIEPL
jgi:rare lipoprotein A